MKIGIIGSGTMGTQIATLFAQSNNVSEVYLCNKTKESADKGKNLIESVLLKDIEKLKRLVLEQELLDGVDATLEKIITGNISICTDCDLIIECVPEDLYIKKEAFKELEKVNKNLNCIFATCTSSLNIKDIKGYLNTPIIGIHFFNPVNHIDLVEIIKDENISDDMYNKVKNVVSQLGKIPIEINDSISTVNRILIPMINEAINIYSEGNISKENIDASMRLGAKHPIGPISLADLIGLDTCLSIMNTLHKLYPNPKYEPSPLLIKMVREGKLGRKTGGGFYKYND